MQRIALALLTVAFAGTVGDARAIEIVQPPSPDQYDPGTRKAVAALRRTVETRDLQSFKQHLAVDAVHWDGKPAYVRSDLVRSPVGQRITIAIDGDRWTITSFVGSD